MSHVHDNACFLSTLLGFALTHTFLSVHYHAALTPALCTCETTNVEGREDKSLVGKKIFFQTGLNLGIRL